MKDRESARERGRARYIDREIVICIYRVREREREIVIKRNFKGKEFYTLKELSSKKRGCLTLSIINKNIDG